jgi:hypothetical protein
MGPQQPYLSLVVTARNDDHGGNLLGRMQIFVNGWIAQARRYHLSSELIIVEWNPPSGRPALQDALQWPVDFGPCTVRFIEVPPQLHARYRYAEALPLYQMIAKNVGIRRARGRFILATNIDILFADELMAFLAEQRLQPGRMYRIDRHDAMSDVPPDAQIEEQIAYCRTHLLRVNAREGTFPVTAHGRRALAKQDIAAADSGISFGRGWFPPERYAEDEVFRWADNDAEIHLAVPPQPDAVLDLDLEPGPGMGQRVMALQVFDGRFLATSARIACRSNIRISFANPATREHLIRLRVSGGGDPVPQDPRILNFRVFSCAWEHPVVAVESLPLDVGAPPLEDSPGTVLALPEHVEPISIVQVIPAKPRRHLRIKWKQLQSVIGRAADGDSITLPVSRSLRQMAAFYVEWGGVTGMIRNGIVHSFRNRRLQKRAPRGSDIFDAESGVQAGDGWYPLERFRNEMFRWVKNNAQIRLPASGSLSTLLLQIEGGPGVDHQPFELLVRNQAGEIVARQTVPSLAFLQIPLERCPGQTEVFTLSLEGGNLKSSADSRILNFRVLWCGVDPPGISVPTVENSFSLGALDSSEDTLGQADSPGEADSLGQTDSVAETGSLGETDSVAETDSLGETPGAVLVAEPALDEPAIPAVEPVMEAPVASVPETPLFLHTNGCGDFTLLAREHWFDLRAYPEFDLFSMNIDSVFCYAAHHAGATEQILPEPMRIYHIEHGTGSGWTPEGQEQLFARLAAKGLPFVPYHDVVAWAAQMRRLNCTMIFNHENWGLADYELREFSPDPANDQSHWVRTAAAPE